MNKTWLAILYLMLFAVFFSPAISTANTKGTDAVIKNIPTVNNIEKIENDKKEAIPLPEVLFFSQQGGKLSPLGEICISFLKLLRPLNGFILFVIFVSPIMGSAWVVTRVAARTSSINLTCGLVILWTALVVSFVVFCIYAFDLKHNYIDTVSPYPVEIHTTKGIVKTTVGNVSVLPGNIALIQENGKTTKTSYSEIVVEKNRQK